MSLFLKPKGEGILLPQRAAYNAQIQTLSAMRAPATAVAQEVAIALNAGRTPGDLYRAFDTTMTLEPKANGEHALLSRVMKASKSVHLGKKAYEYGRTSRVGTAKVSLNGNHGTVIDQAAVNYGGSVIPIFDVGFGVEWRDNLGAQSEGFDILYANNLGAERTIFDKIDSYMFDGDASIVVGENKWLGLRNDPSVAQATIAVDLTLLATTSSQIYNEFQRLVEILINQEDCSGAVDFTVSREIYSRLLKPWDVGTGSNSTMTVLDFVSKIRGIKEIVEDKRLTGNQVALVYIDNVDGFHPLTGMVLSSYALPRPTARDNFDFIKWAATGFLARNSFSGKKCALYAAGA